jgi:hypothetical protein
MAYVLIALLGAACGVLLTWYLLIPVVTLVAVAAGVAGAIKGHPFGSVLVDTTSFVCILEASWITSVFVVARLPDRRSKSTEQLDQARGPAREPSEHEAWSLFQPELQSRSVAIYGSYDDPLWGSPTRWRLAATRQKFNGCWPYRDEPVTFDFHIDGPWEARYDVAPRESVVAVSDAEGVTYGWRRPIIGLRSGEVQQRSGLDRTGHMSIPFLSHSTPPNLSLGQRAERD